MTIVSDSEIQAVYNILEQVADPEIPVLTITDLGIVRDVKISNGIIEVIITPTYTGCPAMDMIAVQIRLALIASGYEQVKIISVLSPAWTTDWITDAGKVKLLQYGIAPPKGNADSIPEDGIACPHCGTTNTFLQSAFGSTACKALYQCEECKEPFEYFKCH